MQKADLTTRAVAGFVDLLFVIGLARLPDVLGFLSATGYILVRDGLFQGRSVGKRLIGLSVVPEENRRQSATYRDSIIRNVPFSVVFILFLIPYAGWVLGPLAFCVECLVALGDDQGMRIGDLLARTCVVQPEQTHETAEQPAPTPAAATEQDKTDVPPPAAGMS